MRKKIVLVLILLFFTKANINALSYGGCDYSTIARLKSLVNNVNVYYDYYLKDDIAYFNVTLTNVPENVYFIDSYDNGKYSYLNTNDGQITIYNYSSKNGFYSFYSSLDECNTTKLGTKYYKFPTYNIYYKSQLCEDIPEFSLCQKWANVNYGYDKFRKLVYDYKNKEEKQDEQPEIKYNKTFLDNIIDFYVKNYYFVLGGVIIICGIALIIKLKKDKFNL